MKLTLSIFVLSILGLAKATSLQKPCDETSKLVALYFKLKPGFSCLKDFPGSTEQGPSTKSQLIKKKYDVLESDILCSVDVCAYQNGSTRFPYQWADGVARFIFTDPAAQSIHYKQSKAIPVPLGYEPSLEFNSKL